MIDPLQARTTINETDEPPWFRYDRRHAEHSVVVVSSGITIAASGFFSYLGDLNRTLCQDLLDALVFIRRSKFVLESGLGGAIQLPLSSLPMDVRAAMTEQWCF